MSGTKEEQKEMVMGEREWEISREAKELGLVIRVDPKVYIHRLGIRDAKISVGLCDIVCEISKERFYCLRFTNQKDGKVNMIVLDSPTRQRLFSLFASILRDH